MTSAPFSIPLSRLSDHVGRELGVSPWVVVDQARVDLFAQATDDHQWVHVDVERAQRDMGGTIAHGFLILSMVSRFYDQIVTVSELSHAFNYGLNKIRFMGQVRVGTRVRARLTLQSLAPRPDGSQLATYLFTIEREGEDRPACIAEAMVLMFPA